MRTFNLFYTLLCGSRLCRKNIRHLSTSYLQFARSISKHKSHTSALPKMEENSKSDIFQGKKDRFNGITVHSDKEKCDVKELPKKLQDSLEFWKENGNRGIWFRIHLSQSDWVPILAKNGFKFHHAEDEFVMMYLWLPRTETCNIPHYAHTMVGVGAVVVNDKSQVLTVSEKHMRQSQPYWKLPGGYVEPGENLIDAVIREVHEETGIITEFQSVLSFRHIHKGMFRCSDIYMVISLKPLSEKIEKCDKEIADCVWMDIDEYMNNPGVSEHNRFFVQKYLEYNKHNIKINCFHGIHQLLDRPYTIYSITKKDIEPHGKVSESLENEES